LKITAIKSFPFQSEYGRSYYVVKVETDEGIYGLGEVGMAFWGRLSRRPWTISRR
jgi:L-alanine-DL-glutamate epimerase-like enolase superfamily enzyme